MSQAVPPQTRKDLAARVARDLFESNRLDEKAVSERHLEATSPEYWKSLHPHVGVCSRLIDSDLDGVATDIEIDSQAEQQYLRKGYLQLDGFLPTTVAQRLKECIELLRRENWPPVFAYVYDEYWLVTRSRRMVRLLSELLGPGYKQLPHIWAHYVHAVGASGWSPHVDRGSNGRALTAWLSLSEATLENGCIYVLPRDRTPEEIVGEFSNLDAVSPSNLRKMLQGSRALPVGAGGLLCWDHELIHWGSSCDGPSQARVSISQEFSASEADAAHGGTLDVTCLPTFAERLQAIATAILAYERFEPNVSKYREVAKRLLKSP